MDATNTDCMTQRIAKRDGTVKLIILVHSGGTWYTYMYLYSDHSTDCGACTACIGALGVMPLSQLMTCERHTKPNSESQISST